MVVSRSPEGWVADRGGSVVGQASALLRPDGRCFVGFRSCQAEAYRPLVEVMAQQLGPGRGSAGRPTTPRTTTRRPTWWPSSRHRTGTPGLVRVWNRPSVPRLGLVAVGRSFRRRGLARLLLARVLGVFHRRGDAEVAAEDDVSNITANGLLAGLGARRTGGSVELRRPGPG